MDQNWKIEAQIVESMSIVVYNANSQIRDSIVNGIETKLEHQVS